ncbi:MAG: hypothetical protein FD545_000064 [Pelagibacterales bacterium]|nr:hypothetical protein [Pelagibacterales bacterium]
MFFIKRILLTLIIILNCISANSHVQHYENLNLIKFDIYRNGKLIGYHSFSFDKVGKSLSVKSDINFEIKKLGVVIYKYNVSGKEVYEDGKLIKFNSKTKQNGKDKYVNLVLQDDKYLIDGSSYKGTVPKDASLGTWWNHGGITSKIQISAVSGRLINQKVTFLGKETISFNGKNYEALRYNFSSTDKSLKKNKKLNTDVWYDEKTLNWIKASFSKKGEWEYKVSEIN